MTRLIWIIIGLGLILTFIVSGILTFIGTRPNIWNGIYELAYVLSLLAGFAYLYLKTDYKELSKRLIYRIGFVVIIIAIVMKLLHLPLNLEIGTIGLFIVIADRILYLIKKVNRSILDYSRVSFLSLFVFGHLTASYEIPHIGKYLLFSSILLLSVGILFDVKHYGIPVYGVVEEEKIGGSTLV